MEKYLIIENENLKENINKLQEMGYKFIVKAKDNFLTGWGQGSVNGHVHLIACMDWEQLETIKHDLYKDKSMSYINWCYIHDIKAIYNYARNKTFTVRNDWTRCFNNIEGVL